MSKTVQISNIMLGMFLYHHIVLIEVSQVDPQIFGTRSPVYVVLTFSTKCCQFPRLDIPGEY